MSENFARIVATYPDDDFPHRAKDARLTWEGDRRWPAIVREWVYDEFGGNFPWRLRIIGFDRPSLSYLVMRSDGWLRIPAALYFIRYRAKNAVEELGYRLRMTARIWGLRRDP